MLVADRALLCIAALLAHGVEQATAETRFGRLGRRIPINNQTTSAVVAPIVAAETPFALLPPQLTESSPTVGSSTFLQSLSELSSSTSIVTVVLLPTVVAPPGPAPTALSPSGESIATPPPAPPAPPSPTSAHLLEDITTAARVVPGIVSSASNVNSTASSDWNATTSTTDSILILTVPPTPTATTESFAEGCTPVTNTATVTVWSIIYTSTTTWVGDRSAYTPPFPPISTPTECTPQAPEAPQTTNRLSVSVCDETGQSCTPYLFGSAAQRTGTSVLDAGTSVTATTVGGVLESPTLVFWTTDKNPSVVFSTSSPPNYGDNDASTLPVEHNTAGGDDEPISTPEFGMWTSTSHKTDSGGKTQASSGVTVIIQTSQIVINGQTITDNPQSKTSTVVVGTDTFVIDPSEVVGAGATIVRPVDIGGIFVSTPTTTTVEGLQVVYGPSVARIDGTVFTIGTTPTTAVVKGQTITVGPAGIAFASQTIPAIQQSGPTEVAVLGGELITAIGSSVVVIKGTTITYGPGSSTITQVVNGDTVLVGPSGVIVHNLTLGGTTAAPSATTYEIVGGATVTEIGSTAVVIGGTTFFIGSGVTSQVTTVVGGATLTIGPGGVSMSTFTFAPYATTTTGLAPGGTSSIASATAKDAGPALRPNWDLGVMGLCIAFGVGFLGQLLY